MLIPRESITQVPPLFLEGYDPHTALAEWREDRTNEALKRKWSLFHSGAEVWCTLQWLTGPVQVHKIKQVAYTIEEAVYRALTLFNTWEHSIANSDD